MVALRCKETYFLKHGRHAARAADPAKELGHAQKVRADLLPAVLFKDASMPAAWAVDVVAANAAEVAAAAHLPIRPPP